MLSWGIVSGAMAFIPHIARTTGLGDEHTFYLLRVLLGLAEAPALLAALGLIAMSIVLTLGHDEVLERTSTQAAE
jgi:hypothetical protein